MRNTFTGRWFTLSVLSLGVGGSFAFLLGMSRAPKVSAFFPENYFQHALVGHVDLAILCWLMISAIVLWSRTFNAKWPAWTFGLGTLGVVLIAFSALAGTGEAVLNNYVPTIISPIFFAGLGSFFLAFVINMATALKEARDGISSDDMVRNAVSVSVLIALVLAISVLTALVMLGGDDYLPQVYYERLFWTPGHIQQVLNGSMLVAVWYHLLSVTTGEKPQYWGFLRHTNKALIASAIILLALLFFFDPMDKPLKIGSEIVYAVGLGIPLFLHIANIFRQYKFKASTPASVALVLSMSIYLLGIFIAYGGFNNDTRVPAHYHGAVTALTLALMAYGYHMFNDFSIKVAFEKIARWQPFVYGIGMVLFISGLFISGLHGAPRKTYGTEWTDNPAVLAGLTAMGGGTFLAVLGGLMFVLYAGVTIIKEEKKGG